MRIDCSAWNVKDGEEHYVGIGAKTEEEAVRRWNGRSKEVNGERNLARY